jgi:Uma2 family endonuclease
MVSVTTEQQKQGWSDEAFMALSGDEQRYEVVDGELVDMGNSGMEYGEIGSFLGGMLALHVRRDKLGIVCDSSTSYTLKSGNRRSPDVSFVAKERLQRFSQKAIGFKPMDESFDAQQIPWMARRFFPGLV